MINYCILLFVASWKLGLSILTLSPHFFDIVMSAVAGLNVGISGIKQGDSIPFQFTLCPSLMIVLLFDYLIVQHPVI